MQLTKIGAAVPHRVYLDAKHYVEQNKVPFFDFYRNCCFGFIEIAPKKGFFTHLFINEKGHLHCLCRCGEADLDEVCGHGFALYLKMIHWPLEKKDLPQAFEKDELIQFFKTAGHGLLKQGISEQGNPRLRLPAGIFADRLLNYWGFTSDEGALTRRDRKSLEKAQNMLRSQSEKKMLQKRFPSGRLLFEESVFYNLGKLFFYLHQKETLDIRVYREADHQIRLKIASTGEPLFDWAMPVATYLKGIQKHWQYWQEKADFEMCKQGLPIVYRIGFLEDNSLKILAMVAIGEREWKPLPKLQVQTARNLYFHENLGYFRIQTGLSAFEMEFSDGALHEIKRDDVKKFINTHRSTWELLDRSLMDQSLFEEIVAEQFDHFEVSLNNFENTSFQYELTARLGKQSFTLEQVYQFLEGQGRYRKIGGKLFDTASYDSVYLQSFARNRSENPLLTPAELFRLLAFFRDRLRINTNELTQNVYQTLKSFELPETPPVSGTHLQLRPYQQLGYQWLYFLKTFGLGGLLCDQMGLGKTHQGMALIQAVLEETPNARVLVVVPTSVLFHWHEKLGHFCPELPSKIHHGPERNGLEDLKRFPILISTYGTMRNDVDLFGETFFDLIIFDEIQALKNQSTKVYKALSRLKGSCKIGLTGTPIENTIHELKSLMDVVFPGYLGNNRTFKKYFSDPIVKHNHGGLKERLKEMVSPFVLRRSKKQVLLELPDKIEDMLSYSLNPYEEELYKEIKEKGISHASGQGKDKPSSTHIFALINKLKQVCNHPALFFKNPDYKAFPSSKWDMFTQLLEDALQSGEKVVVFTQYLGMLAMFKSYLDQRGTPFAAISGSTKNRGEEQKRFMEDGRCRVFLGTLQAAGVGIELTAGSILIHYDRWWNAAREEQATDRIHRIGQNKKVQIYKFKALNTVEERIDRIIRKKAALLDDVIGFDSDQIGKALSIDELLEILA